MLWLRTLYLAEMAKYEAVSWYGHVLPEGIRTPEKLTPRRPNENGVLHRQWGNWRRLNSVTAYDSFAPVTGYMVIVVGRDQT